MAYLKDYFRGLSGIIESKFTASRQSIGHKGLAGSAREVFIKECLEKFFPKKYVIGKGQIIDSLNEISNECDIVIYDENMPVFDIGDTKKFLSAGVLCHLEVKTTLDKEKLCESLNITKSIKNLKRDINPDGWYSPLPERIISGVFAYESLTKETIKKHVNDFYTNENDRYKKADFICVLNKWVMYEDYKYNDKYELIDARLRFLDTGADTLMVFFFILCDYIQKNWVGLFDFNSYINKNIYNEF